MAHPFTIGLDLGDRTSRLCILDPAGEVTEEGRIRPPWRASASLRGAAALAGRPRGRHPLRLGKPLAHRARPRRDRRQPSQAALHLRQREQERQGGCGGAGPLTALCFVLTLEDPDRFPSSRAVGSYLGLRPRQADSGESEPEWRITRTGDALLRRLLVQCAHYMLGPFGIDSDLRRKGLELAARGGKAAKKRALIAVARKLAVLLHRLWLSGEAYEPLREARRRERRATSIA